MNKILSELKTIFDPSQLRTVILFVTAACNFRCPFCCYADNLNQGGDMTFGEIEKITKSIGRFRNLLISGGEPFLRKELAQIFQAFRANAGVEVIDVPSNGWYTEKMAKHVTDFCSSTPDVQLTVSLSIEGFGEVHDQVRQMPGAFARAMDTLSQLAPLRQRFDNFRLKIGSVLTRVNAASIDQLMDHVYANFPMVDEHTIEIERGVDLPRAQFEEKQDFTGEYLRLVRKALSLYYTPERRTRKNKGIPSFLSRFVYPGVLNCTTQIKIDRIHGKMWPMACTAGKSIMVINSKGELSACELRAKRLKLADYDFDVTRARNSPEFQGEVAQIAKDKCDCTHGCFVDTSVRQSGMYYMTHVPVEGFKQKLRTPEPAK